jgi:hypothetical protein
MKKIAFHLILFLLLANSLKADGILMSWGANDLTGMTEERWNAAKTWTTSEIITKMKTATEWPDVYLLLVASIQHKTDTAFFDSLINQIPNTNQYQLTLTSRLIIWERITSNDILFEGKGVQVNDDLFKVAGRANWILRNLTGKDFGYVKMRSAKDSLQLLKDKWTNWRKGKVVEEYKDPYGSTAKGLDEIRSKDALEAIIISLKNTDKKDALTNDCLKRLYHLTELPKDPASPANFCSPDTYSYLYLNKLTGISEKHPYDWWEKWWKANESKLIWNKETAQFEIAK